MLERITGKPKVQGNNHHKVYFIYGTIRHYHVSFCSFKIFNNILILTCYSKVIHITIYSCQNKYILVFITISITIIIYVNMSVYIRYTLVFLNLQTFQCRSPVDMLLFTFIQFCYQKFKKSVLSLPFLLLKHPGNSVGLYEKEIKYLIFWQ